MYFYRIDSNTFENTDKAEIGLQFVNGHHAIMSRLNVLLDMRNQEEKKINKNNYSKNITRLSNSMAIRMFIEIVGEP